MVTPSHQGVSSIDELAKRYALDIARQRPTIATKWGITQYNDRLEDFSPDHWNTVAAISRKFLADLDEAAKNQSQLSPTDAVTVAAAHQLVGAELELHDAGEDESNLSCIRSPLQFIRDCFSLMPRATNEDKEAIRRRLGDVPQALRGYRDSLEKARGEGRVAAAHQVRLVAEQAEGLATGHPAIGGKGADPTWKESVEARAAFAELADYLTNTLLPDAPLDEAVGRQRYILNSQSFLGQRIDPDELHEWGYEVLDGLIAEQRRIARTLYGDGVSIPEAIKRLNEDKKYIIEGTDNLIEWMQQRADEAVSVLNGTLFSIPEQIRALECKIDSAGSGLIFYTPPTDDFSRNGTMWWSVPPSQTRFHTWRELTTIYHEGVPGHHLQFGQALCEKDSLNLWRRVVWNSGHGEGWGLYAEKLMADNGFHDDPATYMGYLDAQRMRAARVVLDTGIHLKKKTRDGRVFDHEVALEFFRSHTAIPQPVLEFEVNRYFGWPGQATCYTVGKHLWTKLRSDCEKQGMSAKQFHEKALAQGSVPLSVLRTALLNDDREVGL